MGVAIYTVIDRVEAANVISVLQIFDIAAILLLP